MKIKSIEHGNYDLLEAIQVIYDNNTKKVYTKDNCNLNELKKDLSLIFKSDIKELKDITNKKIMRDDIILKGGI